MPTSAQILAGQSNVDLFIKKIRLRIELFQRRVLNFYCRNEFQPENLTQSARDYFKEAKTLHS